MTDDITGPAPAPKPPNGGTRCPTPGATGVSRHGTDMVCAVARDGHHRWQRQFPKRKGGSRGRRPQVEAVVLTPGQLAGRPELDSPTYQNIGNTYLDELRAQPNRAAGDAYLSSLGRGYIKAIQEDLGMGRDRGGVRGVTRADKHRLILDAVFGPEPPTFDQRSQAALDKFRDGAQRGDVDHVSDDELQLAEALVRRNNGGFGGEEADLISTERGLRRNHGAPAVPGPGEATTRLSDELRAETSVPEAHAKIADLDAAELERLGEHVGVPVFRRSKQQWRDAIVFHTVQAPGQFARALDISRQELDEQKAAMLARKVQELREQTSSAAAAGMLADMSAAELQDVARHVGLVGMGQLNKDDLKREIVYRTVVGPRTLSRAAGLDER